MSQYNESPTKAFPAGAALTANRRVKLVDGELQYAGASDPSIGILLEDTFASAEYDSGYTTGTVLLVTAQGTRKAVASGAITAGDPVYADANGKVAASGTIVEGRALEAATADGDVIEVLSIANTDISTAITGTTAATFEADSDVGKPRVAIGSQTGGTGDYKAVIKPPSTLTADRTFTLSGDASDTIVGAAAAQTLTNKTLGAGTNESIGGSTAAAGSTNADAAALPAGTARVYPTTGADDGKGVIINSADKVTGRMLFIGNGVSNKILKVYAPSGGSINGGSADAAFSSASGKGVVIVCLNSSSNTWLAW